MSGVRDISPVKLSSAKRRRLRRSAVEAFFTKDEVSTPKPSITREALLRRRAYATDITTRKLSELRHSLPPGFVLGDNVANSDEMWRVTPPSEVHIEMRASDKPGYCVPDLDQVKARAAIACEEAKIRRLAGREVLQSDAQWCASIASAPHLAVLEAVLADPIQIQMAGMESQNPELKDLENTDTMSLMEYTGELRCQKCDAATAECFCDELFCGRCFKVATGCLCPSPFVRCRVCAECGAPESRPSLHCQEPFERDCECRECGHGSFRNSCGADDVATEHNALDGALACSICCRVDDQDGMTQCDGKCTSGSVGLPAMFHEHCIHNVSGALLCPQCHAKRMNRPKAKRREKL